MNWYLKTLYKYVIYLVSGGQLPREAYWKFVLFSFIMGCALGYVAIFVGGSVFIVVIMVLCGLAVLIPGIALSVSRLNDANRSGWWLLISLIPLIGSIVLLGFVAQDSQSNENQCGCNSEDAAV